MKAEDMVEEFIQTTLSEDEEKGWLVVKLREMTLKVYPDAQEEMKYGGIVFNADGELISGIFVRKHHVSLEFSQGVRFSDPDNHLEGSGKHRRHLKLSNEEDMLRKNAEFFVSQAFEG